MEKNSLLRTRRSQRHFTDIKLSAEKVQKIIDEARFAPSGGNDQPWHVTALEPESATHLRSQFEQRAWKALSKKVKRMVQNAGFEGSEEALTQNVKSLIDHGQVVGAPWLLLIHYEKEQFDERYSDEDERIMLGEIEPLVRRDSVVCFAYALCLAAASLGIASCLQWMYAAFADEIVEQFSIPTHHELVGAVLIGNSLTKPQSRNRRSVSVHFTNQSL